MPEKPGKGFLGWLGRQVGHVKKAVQTDPAAAKTIYRNEKVEEVPHPEDPKIRLRRTTIDEAVVDPKRPKKMP
ncbi:MAG TPA: hypothetical protein VL282_16340 [Tepidisphaeraceae bacterium]|jgi:hypothetical protein|nr:hypothetical protein [Tepidisphaeraceae bacterium]